MRPLPVNANFMLHAIAITLVAIFLSGYQSSFSISIPQLLARFPMAQSTLGQ